MLLHPFRSHAYHGWGNCEGTCHPPSPLYVSRAAVLAAGIPDSVPISTVNRLCSSGLMAIRSIAHSIHAGEISLGVAVGVESMSLKSVQFQFRSFGHLFLLFLSVTQSPPHSRRTGYCQRKLTGARLHPGAFRSGPAPGGQPH